MPSKFSKRLGRRATTAMTSKRGNVTYYKGRGGRTEGVHTAKGKYVVLPQRLMSIVAPDLTGFQLKPYVYSAARAPPPGQRVPDWSSLAKPAAQGAGEGKEELR